MTKRSGIGQREGQPGEDRFARGGEDSEAGYEATYAGESRIESPSTSAGQEFCALEDDRQCTSCKRKKGISLSMSSMWPTVLLGCYRRILGS